ncbi:MAG TPA: UDP-N-acetylmuramoyl-tripeptide--D-alanyl-D-alanine ligase, partial [Chlamydiales bacterium]|nr:UDP-N-acetylmuramoyl-tripeptide--D-alanyl-D-alanine ligase [Chlamydiales bacterium]
RRIEPGELFFALQGDRTDGHCYLAEVQERGGIGAVVSKSYGGPEFGLTLIRVDNVLGSLQALAKDAVARSSAQIVAITGTMGKTTTKDFIATLLSGKFRVGKTYASYNTKLTLPITILNMQGDEEIFVLEMGMGEPGDIAKLVEIAPPDIAVLTQIAMAHYGHFATNGLQTIAQAKAEIFHHPKTKKAIFYHGLGQYLGVVESIQSEKLTFSLEEPGADYFFSQGIVDERGVRAYCFTDFPFQQLHVLHNFLAAVSVARTFKMEWDQINAQILNLRLPKMRFEMFEKDSIVFVNDAYNANPESMKAALRSFPEPKSGGKRVAVLGHMAELGPLSREMHESVGKFAQGHVDHLLTFSGDALILNEAFAEAKKPAEHFTTLENLIQRLQELIRPGDVVLVKGSRYLAMERILERLDTCYSS